MNTNVNNTTNNATVNANVNTGNAVADALAVLKAAGWTVPQIGMVTTPESQQHSSVIGSVPQLQNGNEIPAEAKSWLEQMTATMVAFQSELANLKNATNSEAKPTEGEEISKSITLAIAKELKNETLSSIVGIVRTAATGLVDRVDNSKMSTEELTKLITDKFVAAFTTIEPQITKLGEIEKESKADSDQIVLARKEIATIVRSMRTLLALIINCINTGCRLEADKKNAANIVYQHTEKWNLFKIDKVVLPKYYPLNDSIKRMQLYKIYNKCHYILTQVIANINGQLIVGVAVDTDKQLVQDSEISDFKTTMSNIDKIVTKYISDEQFEKMLENFKKESTKEICIIVGAGILVTALTVVIIVICNGGFDEIVNNDSSTVTCNNTSCGQLWGSGNYSASAYGW